MLREEECALGMGHTSNYVAVKDAQVMLKEEECVLSMVQRSSTSDAAVKDVQAMLREEECVSNTGHTSNDAEAKVAKKGGVCIRHDAM